MWICLLTASCVGTEQNRQVITKLARCSHYRAKMSGDVLARKRSVLVAMDADVERVVPRENTHATHWRTFKEVLPTFLQNIWPCIGEDSGINQRYTIHRLTSACDRQIYRRCVGGVMVMYWRYRGDVLKTSWRWYNGPTLWGAYERWGDFTKNHIAGPTLWLPNEIMDKEQINFVQLAYYWVEIDNRANKRKHRRSIADASQSGSGISLMDHPNHPRYYHIDYT